MTDREHVIARWVVSLVMLIPLVLMCLALPILPRRHCHHPQEQLMPYACSFPRDSNDELRACVRCGIRYRDWVRSDPSPCLMLHWYETPEIQSVTCTQTKIVITWTPRPFDPEEVKAAVLDMLEPFVKEQP